MKNRIKQYDLDRPRVHRVIKIETHHLSSEQYKIKIKRIAHQVLSHDSCNCMQCFVRAVD